MFRWHISYNGWIGADPTLFDEMSTSHLITVLIYTVFHSFARQGFFYFFFIILFVPLSEYLPVFTIYIEIPFLPKYIIGRKGFIINHLYKKKVPCLLFFYLSLLLFHFVQVFSQIFYLPSASLYILYLQILNRNKISALEDR